MRSARFCSYGGYGLGEGYGPRKGVVLAGMVSHSVQVGGEMGVSRMCVCPRVCPGGVVCVSERGVVNTPRPGGTPSWTQRQTPSSPLDPEVDPPK